MWVYNNTAGTIYDYQPNREGINAKNMLDEFQGYVQSDAYGGYNLLFTAESGRVSVGCWAHARRKFVEVTKVLDGADKNRNKDSHADQMIKLIAGLYKIEAECKELKLTKDQVTKVRQDQALPILTDIKKKLDEWLLSARPSSALGKAIAYSLNNWQTLTRYVEHGQVPIDNNDTERKVKPFVIGRKTGCLQVTLEVLRQVPISIV
jgi:transposase